MAGKLSAITVEVGTAEERARAAGNDDGADPAFRRGEEAFRSGFMPLSRAGPMRQRWSEDAAELRVRSASAGNLGPAVAAVEVRDVTHHFRGQAALRAVTLSIEADKFFSLLGPRRCGKTTTLNIIGGFVIPDQGDVLIQGRSMRRVPPYARPVNTVFQNYALFPHMTVAENVGFGPRMARVGDADAKRRVGEALDLVALSGMENRHPDQLSGGQQQRIALARALVVHPAGRGV